MFGEDLIGFKSLNLQNEVDTVCESDDEIGFVEVRYAVVFIRDTESEVVVTDITFDNFGLLQSKLGCAFPCIGIQYDLVHMALLCFGAGGAA